jgi:hypothetical protein
MKQKVNDHFVEITLGNSYKVIADNDLNVYEVKEKWEAISEFPWSSIPCKVVVTKEQDYATIAKNYVFSFVGDIKDLKEIRIQILDGCQGHYFFVNNGKIEG